jgi:hypothetical protein
MIGSKVVEEEEGIGYEVLELLMYIYHTDTYR